MRTNTAVAIGALVYLSWLASQHGHATGCAVFLAAGLILFGLPHPKNRK